MANIHPNMLNEAMNVNKSRQTKLYVGMCGTQFVGSDRYAVVITEIVSPKCVRVTHMNHNDYDNNRLIDENDNEYLDPRVMVNYAKVNRERTGFVISGQLFKLRKNGRWVEEGNDLWSTGAVHFGEADEYRDPSF